MVHNTGTSYELLTREIFQCLIKQDSARNIDVKHDISLQGKTTKHQIDVYWEFEIGGISYTTVVQVKDWNRTLDQGELLKFREVLNDLPGQPRGIVVTRSGYQRGAEQVAKANGILLFELFEESHQKIVITEGSFAELRIWKRTPTGLIDPKNPAGSNEPGNLIMQTIVFDPIFSELRFECDQYWLKEQKEYHDDQILSEIVSQQIIARPRDVKLYDASGSIIGDLQEIFSSFVKEMRIEATMNERKLRKLQVPTFLKIPSQALPYIKISAVSSNVLLKQREPYEVPFRIAKLVHFILRNINTGTEEVFAVAGQSESSN